MNPFKLKVTDLARPDKLLIYGINSLSSVGSTLYSTKKQQAKANAELTHIGTKKVEKVETQLFKFNPSSNTIDKQLTNFEFLEKPEQDFNYWLNFHGIHDVDHIETVGSKVALERLTLRQILDTTQRPKIEHYDHYLFINRLLNQRPVYWK